MKRKTERRGMSVLACVLMAAILAIAVKMIVQGYEYQEMDRFQKLTNKEAVKAGVYYDVDPEVVRAEVYVDTLTGYMYTKYGPLTDINGRHTKMSDYDEGSNEEVEAVE